MTASEEQSKLWKWVALIATIFALVVIAYCWLFKCLNGGGTDKSLQQLEREFEQYRDSVDRDTDRRNVMIDSMRRNIYRRAIRERALERSFDSLRNEKQRVRTKYVVRYKEIERQSAGERAAYFDSLISQ